jgi:hypothetical protein
MLQAMRSKPEVDAEIAKLVKKHIRLDKAANLLSDLSKVGGNRFRDVMTRVKRIIENQRG